MIMISEDWSDTELIIFENGCVCLQRADQQTVEVHNITTSASSQHHNMFWSWESRWDSPGWRCTRPETCVWR